MALGRSRPDRGFQTPRDVLGDRLVGIYRLLADHGDRLFPDDYFADLYEESAMGQPTVPARQMATVLVLQSQEGLSDYEAVDRIGRDLAWQAAAGLPVGADAFHQSTLVRFRVRLSASGRPKRFLQDTAELAAESGAMSGRARAVDSTPIFDAVATQDTVTQLRATIRTLLAHLDRTDPAAAGEVRAALCRDDDYKAPGKPPCDWGDRDARGVLVDELVRDVLAAVAVFDGVVVADPWLAAHLLFMADIAGQDVAQGDDGVFFIVDGVAKDRVISTVDRQARHGHKSKSRRFDGFKAHIRSDPDGEFIDDLVVTPANVADGEVLTDILADLADSNDKPTIYADAGYGAADLLEGLADAGFDYVIKVPSPTRRAGRWSKGDFDVDTDNATVTCPAAVTIDIAYRPDSSGIAAFGDACGGCDQAEQCTTSKAGRTVAIHRREDILQTERHKQGTDPAWAADYTATRPKVERKLGHLIRKPWGGRRARRRGATRIAGDLFVRAAAINLARLAALNLTWDNETGWQAQPP